MNDSTGSQLPATVSQALAMPVKNMQDLSLLGQAFEDSGIFGCTQKGQGTVLVVTCISEGISPLKFSQTYHIIEGKVAMKADAMYAKFLERGGEVTIEERSDKRAAATFVKGKNKLKVEYTMEQAKEQGLPFNKDNQVKPIWKKFPKQMLWARLVSDTVRALDPGVNAGTYTPEEVADMDVASATGNSRRVDPDSVKTEPPGEPAPKVEVVNADPSKCPIAGPFLNKPWSDVNQKALDHIAKNRGKMSAMGMTDGHHDAVDAELSARAAKKGEVKA